MDADTIIIIVGGALIAGLVWLAYVSGAWNAKMDE